MSMHLAHPSLSTTSTKKKTAKLTKSKLAELDLRWRERNKKLRQMGLPKETFDEFLAFVHGKSTKNAKKVEKSASFTAKTPHKVVDYRRDTGDIYNTVSKETKIVDPLSCAKKASPVYTGTMVKGIATMHKSNAVPIFNYEDAIDISKMRR